MSERDAIAKTQVKPYPEGKAIEKTKQANPVAPTTAVNTGERPRIKSNVPASGGGSGVGTIHAFARLTVSSTTITTRRIAGCTAATVTVGGEDGVRLTFSSQTSDVPVVKASCDDGTIPLNVDPLRTRSTSYVDVTHKELNTIPGTVTREFNITIID